MRDNGREIGHGSVAFYLDGNEKYEIPPKTAVYGATAIDEKYRGKGLGSQLLSEAEDMAKSKGMKHMEVHNVENARFFANHGYYYAGYQRIFVKDFGKSISESQAKQTREYTEIFPSYGDPGYKE